MERQGTALLLLGGLRHLKVVTLTLPVHLAGPDLQTLPLLIQVELQLLDDGRQGLTVYHSGSVLLLHILKGRVSY